MNGPVMNGPIIVTAAASNPVTVAEAEVYSSISAGTADAQLARFISAATKYVEARTGQQLIQATLKQTWSIFPGMQAWGASQWNGLTADDQWCRPFLTLDRRPVQSVSWVKYYDANGTLTTLDSSNYWTDLNHRPPRLMPTANSSWPETQLGRPESVQVQYVAGYASQGDIPEGLLVAILALVDHWMKNPGVALTSGGVPQALPYSLEELINLYDQKGYT